MQTKTIDHGRRQLLGVAATTVAAAVELRFGNPARAQAAATSNVGNVPGVLKQIDAGVLSVGYVEAGPSAGPVVILLHGWPYDIHAFAEVVPVLTAARYRVIVPYLRGYGTTRFLTDNTVRNGQQAALAVDVVALMDALGIARAVLGGRFAATIADIRHVAPPVLRHRISATFHAEAEGMDADKIVAHLLNAIPAPAGPIRPPS